MKHVITKMSGGSAESGWEQNICECGWEGEKHYAWQDLQLTLLKDEAANHLRTNP